MVERLVPIGDLTGPPGPRGLPGVNGVSNDMAMAELIEGMDTQTRLALEKYFVPKNQYFYDVSDHGISGGSEDVTEALQSLIDEVPDGSTIRGAVGVTYRTTGVLVDDKSLTLDFSNSILVQLGENPIVTAKGHWSDIQNVTSASRGAASGVNTSAYQPGDLVKVYSRDLVPDARSYPEGGARLGEFSYVYTKTADTINLRPVILDTYSNNIKIAKMSNARVAVYVGEAYSESTKPGGPWTNLAMFRFIGLRFPLFKGYVSSGMGTAIFMQSCYSPFVDARVENLPFADGYAAYSGGSADGYYRINAAKTRHAWTDGAGNNNPITTEDFADPSNYGRSERETITGTVIGNETTSFDTHHGGRNHHFIRCTAKSQRDSGALFTVRGREHTYTDCHAETGSFAWRFYNEESEAWATSFGHSLNGCSSKDVVSVFDFSLNSIAYQPTFHNFFTAEIQGGSYEFKTGSINTGYHARLYMNNPVFYSNDTYVASNASNGLINISGAGTSPTLLGSCLIRLPNIGSGTPLAIVAARYDVTRVNVNINLLLNQYAQQAFKSLVSAIDDPLVVVNFNSNVPIKNSTTLLAGANNTKPAGNRRVTFKSAGQYSATDMTTEINDSSYVSTTPVAGQPLTLSASGNDIVNLVLASSGAVTVPGITEAYNRFQRLHIYNRGPGAVTIPSGGTNMGASVGALSIAANTSVDLAWDPEFSVWRKY